jgi:hypothetical protein
VEEASGGSMTDRLLFDLIPSDAASDIQLDGLIHNLVNNPVGKVEKTRANALV